MIIGGPRCNELIEERFIESDGNQLTDSELEILWGLFVQIGRYWDNATSDSSILKSSWLEFIEAKTTEPRTKEDLPSYAGEYRNALIVFAEMQEYYGNDSDELRKMFFTKTEEVEQKTDLENKRLGHAKTFVVNEFIKVYVVSGGFKSFAGKNYNGFIKGSRFNEEAPVSVYPESSE